MTHDKHTPSNKNSARSTRHRHSMAMPVPDLRPLLPQLIVQNGASKNGQIPVGTDSGVSPPTPSSPQASPSRSVDRMKEMWRGVIDRDTNRSKSEKRINKISNAASALRVVQFYNSHLRYVHS